MTVTTDAPGESIGPSALAMTETTHSTLVRLLRSERRKLSSTKTWWLFAIAIFVTTALTLLGNIGNAYNDFQNSGFSDTEGNFTAMPPTMLAVAKQAANIYTSGQYFGGLFVMLLAILMITNEYYHQTATTTFLATPHRSSVIASKLLMAMMIAACVWVLTTVIDLIGGSIFLNAQGYAFHLGDWIVGRAILINLLMFGLWAVFGIGLGALLRSQIGATVTAALLYTVGIYAALAVFALIRTFIYHHDSVFKGMVLVPAVAAQIAESSLAIPIPEGQIPPWWLAVIVMFAYGAVMGVVGTLILRKRDIS